MGEQTSKNQDYCYMDLHYAFKVPLLFLSTEIFFLMQLVGRVMMGLKPQLSFSLKVARPRKVSDMQFPIH